MNVIIFSAGILLWKNTEVFGDFCLEFLIFSCMLISDGSVLYQAGCEVPQIKVPGGRMLGD